MLQACFLHMFQLRRALAFEEFSCLEGVDLSARKRVAITTVVTLHRGMIYGWSDLPIYQAGIEIALRFRKRW